MRSFQPLLFVFFAVSLFPAVLLHELSHGYVAARMGDLTPRLSGRLTLRPRPHIDAFGTVIVPGLLLFPVLFGLGGLVFGYAKPMPIRRENLTNAQIVWIAAAGVLTNLSLAVLGAVGLRLVGGAEGGLAANFLFVWILTNVVLAVFHLFPVPPFDMSRVVALYLPERARAVYTSWEPYGALFVLVLLFILRGPVLALVEGISGGLLDLLVA